MSIRIWMIWMVNKVKSFWAFAPHWILAVTAIVALLISFCQLQRTQQETAEQLKLTQSALDLAKRSAEVSQRAWVLVTGVTFQEIVAEKPFQVTLRIKNVGASPALDLRLITSWLATTAPVPEQLEVSPPPHPPSQAVLGPGESATVPIQIEAIPTQVFTRIQHDTGSLLIYGQITYHDPLATDRRTTFRVMYNPSTKEFQYAASGNTIQ